MYWASATSCAVLVLLGVCLIATLSGSNANTTKFDSNMWCCAMKKHGDQLCTLASLANVCVYFLLLAKSQNCAVDIGLRLRRAGPLSLMLNTPPRVVVCYFKTPRRPRGERVGQPIKKYAYTRLLISRRPFKVCGSGGGAIYLLSAAADCQ